MDKKRTRLRVVVRCPAGGPSCTAGLFAVKGKKLLAPAQTITIPAGTSVAQKVKLSSAIRKGLKAKGFRATIGVISAGGTDTRKATVKRLPKAKKKRATRR